MLRYLGLVTHSLILTIEMNETYSPILKHCDCLIVMKSLQMIKRGRCILSSLNECDSESITIVRQNHSRTLMKMMNSSTIGHDAKLSIKRHSDESD